MPLPSKTRSLSIFAPAKINLYLHITGKQNDGYHLLDSLVSFTDIGDMVEIKEANTFAFEVKGPFAKSFNRSDADPSRNSSNLIVRAAYALSDIVQKDLKLKIILTKNLPLGSGIGGGSSNAAACIWALIEWWKLPPHPDFLKPLLLELGSDVPVCYPCRPAVMRGIGEELYPAPEMPELHILLVQCGKSLYTAPVYQNFSGSFSAPAALPEKFDGINHLIDFLQETQNDLTESAIEYVPEIAFALDLLGQQKGVLLSRMSGSGSTCFGLFRTEEECMNAAEVIIREHPLWWVRAGTLGRPVRY